MNYLLTAKRNGQVEKQIILNYDLALNTIRRIMLNIAPMEETSADLRAIAMLKDVKPGKAAGIEHGNMKLIVQVHKG